MGRLLRATVGATIGFCVGAVFGFATGAITGFELGSGDWNTDTLASPDEPVPVLDRDGLLELLGHTAVPRSRMN